MGRLHGVRITQRSRDCGGPGRTSIGRQDGWLGQLSQGFECFVIAGVNAPSIISSRNVSPEAESRFCIAKVTGYDPAFAGEGVWCSVVVPSWE